MFEELHAGDEQRLSTSHPKIIVAQRMQVQNAELPHEIAELERLARTDPQKIPTQLQKIVPEYSISGLTVSYISQSTALEERRIAA